MSDKLNELADEILALPDRCEDAGAPWDGATTAVIWPGWMGTTQSARFELADLKTIIIQWRDLTGTPGIAAMIEMQREL